MIWLLILQAIQEAAEQRARAQEETSKKFRGGFWGSGFGRGPRGPMPGTSSAQRARRDTSESRGPVIDVEWSTVDDEK